MLLWTSHQLFRQINMLVKMDCENVCVEFPILHWISSTRWPGRGGWWESVTRCVHSVWRHPRHPDSPGLWNRYRSPLSIHVQIFHTYFFDPCLLLWHSRAKMMENNPLVTWNLVVPSIAKRKAFKLLSHWLFATLLLIANCWCYLKTCWLNHSSLKK